MQRAERYVRHTISGKRFKVEDDPVTGQQQVTHADGSTETIVAGDGVWLPESTIVPLTDTAIAQVAQMADAALSSVLDGNQRKTQWIDLRPEIRRSWINGNVQLEGPRAGLNRVIREYLESVRLDGE